MTVFSIFLGIIGLLILIFGLLDMYKESKEEWFVIGEDGYVTDAMPKKVAVQYVALFGGKIHRKE